MFVNWSVVVGNISKDDKDALRDRDLQEVQHPPILPFVLLLILLLAITKNVRASMGVVILSVTMAVLAGLLEEASMKKSGAKIVSPATQDALITCICERMTSLRMASATTVLPQEPPRNATPKVFLMPFVEISFISDCSDNAKGDFAIEFSIARGFFAYTLGIPSLLLMAFYFFAGSGYGYGRATNVVFAFLAAVNNVCVSAMIIDEIIRRTITEADLKDLDEALIKEVDARRGLLANRATKKADRMRRRR